MKARTKSELAAHAVIAAYQELFARAAAGWSIRRGDVVAVTSDVSLPYFNGMWIGGPDWAEGQPELLIDRVRSIRDAAYLQVDPSQEEIGTALAARTGMRRADPVPLLAISKPIDVPVPTVFIERVHGDAVEAHLAVAEPAFGAPTGSWASLFRGMFASPDVDVYVARDAGRPVATLLTVRAGGALGVFNVATDPDRRRRGLAAAVLTHAVADGLREGSQFVWLQSSPDSHHLYESLGFSVVTRWPTWIID